MTDLGNKIKENRTKLGLTQKALADKLYVTPQAVSRWENDGIEPPIDSIKKMCKIFNISLDEFLGVEKENVVKEENKQEVVTQPTVEVQKTVIVQSYGICDRCHNLLKGPDDIHDIIHPGVHRSRNRSIPETKERVCTDCYNLYLKKQADEQRAKQLQIEKKAKDNRIKACILGPLISIVLGIIFGVIIGTNSKNGTSGVVSAILGSIFFFPFTACLFLNNNCISLIFIGVASFFFVKWPGIIFSFDLDGFAFLIAMKLLFAVLGFIIGIIGILFALMLSSVIAVFAVIPSFIKSVKNPEDLTL